LRRYEYNRCMSIYIHKSHNVTVLLYHLVFPAKYRQIIFDPKLDHVIKDICLEIAKRYEMHFLEIGTDNDHAHFLIQSVPLWTVTRLVTTIKSVTAREAKILMPEIKHKLWNANLWTSGYYAATVSRNGSETAIYKYVKEQGRDKEYVSIHKDQLSFSKFSKYFFSSSSVTLR